MIEFILALIGSVFVVLYIHKTVSKRSLKEDLGGIIDFLNGELDDLEDELDGFFDDEEEE